MNLKIPTVAVQDFKLLLELPTHIIRTIENKLIENKTCCNIGGRNN